MILPKLLQNAHRCSLSRLCGPDIAAPEVLNTNCNCPSEYGVHVGAVGPNAAAKSTFGSPVRTNDTTEAAYSSSNGARSAGLGKLSGNSAITFSPCVAGGTSISSVHVWQVLSHSYWKEAFSGNAWTSQ